MENNFGHSPCSTLGLFDSMGLAANGCIGPDPISQRFSCVQLSQHPNLPNPDILSMQGRSSLALRTFSTYCFNLHVTTQLDVQYTRGGDLNGENNPNIKKIIYILNNYYPVVADKPSEPPQWHRGCSSAIGHLALHRSSQYRYWRRPTQKYLMQQEILLLIQIVITLRHTLFPSTSCPPVVWGAR